MPLPKRPRDPTPRSSPSWLSTWHLARCRNDKDQVLAALSEQEHPTGRAKSAKARAASQTAERRSEVARRASAARWGT